MLTVADISRLIRDVPDFPKPGILFKDITPVLGDAHTFRALVHHLCELVPAGCTKLVAVESRGFLLGSAMALQLQTGVALVRKPGKLPYRTHAKKYDLEYGQDELHMHVDAMSADDQVVIVDDVLATGGTAAATEALCTEAGARVLGAVFFLELAFLKGRGKLRAPARSLISL